MLIITDHQNDPVTYVRIRWFLSDTDGSICSIFPEISPLPFTDKPTYSTIKRKFILAKGLPPLMLRVLTVECRLLWHISYSEWFIKLRPSLMSNLTLVCFVSLPLRSCNSPSTISCGFFQQMSRRIQHCHRDDNCNQVAEPAPTR